MLVGLALVLLGVVCGRVVLETEAIEVGTGQLLFGSVVVLAALAVIFAGPVACVAAVAAFTIYSPTKPFSLGGGIHASAADAFAVGLVGWWVVYAAGLTRGRAAVGVRAPIRSGPALVFLAYAGLTLLYIAVVEPGGVSHSSTSWLRLVETALLAWLAATFIRTRRDLALVLGAVAVAGTIAVVLALAGGTGAEEGSGPLGERGGGVLNANTLGLVSGLLVLMAFIPALSARLAYRVPLVIVGCVGLVQSASVASIFGTAVALAVGLSLSPRATQTAIGARATNALTALVLALVLGFGIASLVRPENLPTSEGFYHNSAGQRVVLGAAGLEIAEDNPIIGVGWQRSSDPDIIGDPDVTTAVRARFKDTREDFFPDVEPTQVHNTYVQVPAELGFVGLGIFLFMIWSLGRDIRRVNRRAPAGRRESAQLWFLSCSLVLVLLWLNDNPIYGGQTETVIPTIFIGAIAGLGATLLGASKTSDRQAAP